MASMQSLKTKIGLVGAGAIIRLSHAPTIKASKEAQLVAVFDIDLRRAEAVTSDFGGTPFDNLEAMLSMAGLDAVIVATPNKFHEEGVVAAARHGKHVLCEKPLSIDAAAARRMVKACADAKVILQVGFNQRFWGQVEIAKQLLDSGFIGTVHQMRSIYSEKSTAYPASTRYRYDLEQSGGATIIDLTVHRIDLARHLVGDFSGVFAELVHSELPEVVDDNVFLLARFANGARGSLAGNRYSPNIGDGTDLFGTEGTIHIASETVSPFASAPLAVYTEKSATELPDVLREAHYPHAWWKGFEGGWITVKPPRHSPYAKQLAAFCESVREGMAPKISGIDGLRAQEFVQGTYLSAQSGRWVNLPLAENAPFVIPNYT
jgi:predicted dehydrogenase